MADPVPPKIASCSKLSTPAPARVMSPMVLARPRPTPATPMALPALAVFCDARLAIAVMQHRADAMPVTADADPRSPKVPVAANPIPAAKMPKGMPYSSKYSLGSSGLLKRSSIFPATAKPPAMLTKLSAVAAAPAIPAPSAGRIPFECDARRDIPPTAVMPLMAFVTAMRGLCSAGATPQTTCWPARPARAKEARSAEESEERAKEA
mmetsp:Transcript_9168/g.18357  ORF Transcript_9168/g.18357 Transcript_9168/m.18357 type:complete len:208 (-) Transcript_9168:1630-2253(-)